MTLTDPIADLLTRIRNASRARKNFVHVPHSKMKEAICQVLKEKGYVRSAKTVGEGVAKEIMIELDDAQREITLKSISKPGQRIYVKTSEIPKILNGLGLAILSTPKGIMSGQAARKAKLGGELLCEVY